MLSVRREVPIPAAEPAIPWSVHVCLDGDVTEPDLVEPAEQGAAPGTSRVRVSSRRPASDDASALVLSGSSMRALGTDLLARAGSV